MLNFPNLAIWLNVSTLCRTQSPENICLLLLLSGDRSVIGNKPLMILFKGSIIQFKYSISYSPYLVNK